MKKTERGEHQNVTVMLPTDLLREVRHLAVDEGISLSRFIAQLLEQKVEERRAYGAARERQLALMQTGLPLGTRAVTTWDRSELHER